MQNLETHTMPYNDKLVGPSKSRHLLLLRPGRVHQTSSNSNEAPFKIDRITSLINFMLVFFGAWLGCFGHDPYPWRSACQDRWLHATWWSQSSNRHRRHLQQRQSNDSGSFAKILKRKEKKTLDAKLWLLQIYWQHLQRETYHISTHWRTRARSRGRASVCC